MNALALPAMAISFAIPAVAGQNFDGRQPERVAETLEQGPAVGRVLKAHCPFEFRQQVFAQMSMARKRRGDQNALQPGQNLPCPVERKNRT